MNNLVSILLMGPPQEGQNPIMSFVFLALIIVVFYFFMIRPQMKKQKELRQYRDSLQKGDKIITLGGIYGKIADVKEDWVVIEVEDQVKLRIDKSAIVKDASDLQQKK